MESGYDKNSQIPFRLMQGRLGIYNKNTFNRENSLIDAGHSATLYYSVVHPIEHKYIPDSVKTKIIDLDKNIDPSDYTSITMEILSLLENGGGTVKLNIADDAVNNFWRNIPYQGNCKLKFGDMLGLTTYVTPTISYISYIVGKIGISRMFFEVRLGKQTLGEETAVFNFDVELVPGVGYDGIDMNDFDYAMVGRTTLTVTPV